MRPASPARAIHLDPVGGIAGDMFIAAALDAFPDLADAVWDDLRRSYPPQSVCWSTAAVRRAGLAAQAFRVEVPAGSPLSGSYSSISQRLQASALAPAIRDRAIELYRLLAHAESKAHGVPIDDVHFHELADWDSWIDLVGAASIIERLGACEWSVGELPLGGGSVVTAHGRLPVPVPAVTTLLEGFRFYDDGIGGERVTPSGAAILRHLVGEPTASPGGARRLVASGSGAGTRELAGVANLLRVLGFETVSSGNDSESVVEIAFEIDDMTPEELATAMDRLRAMAPVLDVGYALRYGKKGRVQYAVRLLAVPAGRERVIEACFIETTTIGLRWQNIARRVLERQRIEVSDGDGAIGVKLVERAGQVTAKAENDDLGATAGCEQRRRRRRVAEREARDARHDRQD